MVSVRAKSDVAETTYLRHSLRWWDSPSVAISMCLSILVCGCRLAVLDLAGKAAVQNILVANISVVLRRTSYRRLTLSALASQPMMSSSSLYSGSSHCRSSSAGTKRLSGFRLAEGGRANSSGWRAWRESWRTKDRGTGGFGGGISEGAREGGSGVET